METNGFLLRYIQFVYVTNRRHYLYIKYQNILNKLIAKNK